ncbi:MAG TPA: glycosyltransferase family 4 protein [Chthonomonadaceae bacterium]|nr:glycosyltransferase family 4 protein [Chthonomonadaceae bacterium]
MKAALSFSGCHRRGGVERILFECARFLASRQHDVTVFASEWEEDSTQPIRYHYVPMRRQPGFLRGASYFQACTQELTGFSYDVLNTHGCICPVGGVHWVQSIHASWLERSKQLRAPLSLSRLKQRLNPLHPVLLRMEARHFRDRSYRKIIATTWDVRDDLKRFYGVPEDDVVVIPNGFSPTEFNPERRLTRRDEMRRKLGLSPEHIALLFVANELERKGYPTILEALTRLKRPDIRLLVVGRASTITVEQQAARRGLSEQVIACGSTQDVSAFHAAGDLFVLPTQYEAFCLAILEALGSGLPVVTSMVPGARDAIQPGINGALIADPRNGEELAEALLPLLDRERRETFAAQASETVRPYQWPVVLERYERVLLDHCS